MTVMYVSVQLGPVPLNNPTDSIYIAEYHCVLFLTSHLIFFSTNFWREKKQNQGCLPFDRKIWLGCRKQNGKRFTSLPQNCHIRYGLNPKKGWSCEAWVWNREGTEKLVNGKQHSIWFVPTRMNRLPQNVVLNFRLEFPKSDLAIYLPSRNFEIFFQMVSTPGLE